ncbi:hypothetical protein KUTeg_004241 [Tegillarca granosa]|uniref:Uncharacterized protein n=1 Tax=Tegillarca granosa TaxID=220873 RepID=A0ABQ9FS99_TEGGR|nr:hypothetical protein KUTeg_004241 [Tegillarca granosa]
MEKSTNFEIKWKNRKTSFYAEEYIDAKNSNLSVGWSSGDHSASDCLRLVSTRSLNGSSTSFILLCGSLKDHPTCGSVVGDLTRFPLRGILIFVGSRSVQFIRHQFIQIFFSMTGPGRHDVLFMIICIEAEQCRDVPDTYSQEDLSASEGNLNIPFGPSTVSLSSKDKAKLKGGVGALGSLSIRKTEIWQVRLKQQTGNYHVECRHIKLNSDLLKLLKKRLFLLSVKDGKHVNFKENQTDARKGEILPGLDKIRQLEEKTCTAKLEAKE